MSAWREEVLAASDIVQDGDESVSDGEREARFDRFVELVSDVKGDEDDVVFHCSAHDDKRGKLRFRGTG